MYKFSFIEQNEIKEIFNRNEFEKDFPRKSGSQKKTINDSLSFIGRREIKGVGSPRTESAKKS
jgi:hypothetical protein